ncbi:MAG: hypothetical protein QOF61_2808 [Acidobacteriota bacterium]|nr:hypothetical protein [Acidobacteriota bacterium]
MSISLQKLKDIKGVRGIVYRSGELGRRARFAARGAYNFAQLRAEQNGARPSVTAVVVGRNDDYMSDFRQRLEATIEWNARHLADEVIFIEWNPPPERELLSERLTQRFEFVRAYVVPPRIHDAVCDNPNIKLLEYHAKNVGVRRARTDWIVTTNADAAFAPDSVRALLGGSLRDDVIWTTQRVDIPWREGRARAMGLADILRYRRVSPYNPMGTGEFAFASRELWHRARGYDEALSRHRIGADMRGVAQMMAHGARTQRAGFVLHLAHPTSCSEGVQPHHGEWAGVEGIPYHNPDDWGLADARETQLAQRVWRLEAD